MSPRALARFVAGATVLAVCLAAPATHANDEVDVVFINGIDNTLEDAKATLLRIDTILSASANHPAPTKKTFVVSSIYNPAGLHGTSSTYEDLEELYILKTSEEHFLMQFPAIVVPFNAPVDIDKAAALAVAAHLDDMTPGANSLEADGTITDADMAPTQAAALRLADRISSGCRPLVVVAHSEGNLLTNLAYAKAASESPELVKKRVRVVDVANTARFSASGLNFTHSGDNALFGAPTGLEILPIAAGWKRSTPECPVYAPCQFLVAPPSLLEPEEWTLTNFADHGMLPTYLSEVEVPTVIDAPGVPFTPGKRRFVDRFEDFVYAAATSFEPPPPSASPGRYTAFVSHATNLVPGDGNGFPDVFVNDATTGETWLASQTFAGGSPNGPSSSPSVSGDGRFVAYVSQATNLVPGDTNGVADVFVFDRDALQTFRVTTPGGVQADGPSREPVISADGSVVAFTSDATNLVEGDGNKKADVFVWDRISGKIFRVSVGPGGAQGNGDSVRPSVSADGCRVAFESVAKWKDSASGSHVYVHDRGIGASTLVSTTPTAAGNNGSTNASINADGTKVVFLSNATNLVAGENNAKIHVYLVDLSTHEVARVSVGVGDVAGDDWSGPASLSGDGRYVAFLSRATNLVPGDTNDAPDVFVRDLLAGVTFRVSLNADGSQDAFGSEGQPAISRDGRFVAFYSLDNKLVSTDDNGQRDVFVRDRMLGTMRRASVSSDGTQSDGDSSTPAVSP